MSLSHKIDRREVLRSGLFGIVGVATGLRLAGYSPVASAQDGAQAGSDRMQTEALTERLTLISGVPGNVLALATENGIVLVDSGSAGMAEAISRSLDGAAVSTLFNTHYHSDQTGGNALFGEAGATIHAHEITRQWLTSDYYIPAEDRWVTAPPAVARPTQTFRTQATLSLGGERIDTGYLLEAHTRGDIYVFFRDANVLAVGDVASPVRDPVHDWYAGGWLGGRVDALDDLLAIANSETRIVPAYGPVMTRTELEAERDMMSHLYDRTAELVNAGRSAEDLLEVGVLDEVDRRFDDPYRFLYDVAKGLWAHYTNFGGNVV